ncbi:MAG: acyl-CoA dehydrogenase family protein [Planctomycetes bacterium]|nr:acyl-CoA dehydrogenase family protein [Planctomycetota bacterium]
MSLSFEPDEDLQAIVEAVRGFAEGRLRPRLRDFEAAGGLPDELMQECFELGLTTLALPEALGGSDLLDIRAAALCSEELAWGDLGAAVAMPGPRSAGFAALELGTPEQQARLLGPFTDAGDGWRRRGALALVEGPFGIDPGAVETTARREGDAWVLRGAKRYVQAAEAADLTVVLARDEASRAPDPWDRLGLFAVVGRPDGLVAAPRSKTMGLHTARWGALELKDVRVPAADRLGAGAPGELLRALRRTVARKKVLDAARLVGCTRAASEYAFKYATEREAFGVKLFEHQALAFMMADMATHVDGLRALVWHAAWSLDRGEDGWVECRRAHDLAADLAVQVTSDAVQVLGGHGYLWDHPVEKWMRDARTLGLVDGLFFDEGADLLALGK